MVLDGDLDVHGKGADHEGGHHDPDGDDVQGLHQHVEVVGDDGDPGVHQAG